ncbi:L-2-hydroxyglutarate oxidase [Aliigemmobacter aestuarii]|uniref:L-2-hydroxyglutarate oxidase n=1 Tax=Aliigemmobacter aestuarii TaxID=1445661 RepID=A0A4S3MQU1_9RHOB|nr:L-2-hydroxyglutarate oxidase [Gemmobacter aestuarii]THD84787.1 L-2-hydroxyglutarate oxidase [Gemmobacter aestuarii]
MERTADVIILGGGIVGLATALELQRRMGRARLILIEKEAAVALHQSGRNSGVIHAGVYYAPGSLKARFCRAGVAATRDFCDEHAIPHQTCGKLIVATDANEVVRMRALQDRAEANGIPIEPLTGAEARALEPNIRAEAALLSPSTGIVDYAAVARRMAELFTARGGQIRTGLRVTGGGDLPGGVILRTDQGALTAGKAVICAGLHADRLALAFGAQTDTGAAFRIIPFRGEYFRILHQPDNLVNHLIYPVPDPDRPFLGVHLTRKMDGGFTVGPNAVLAGGREAYSRLAVAPRDLAGSLVWPGFWRLVARNFTPAMGELAASASTRLYLARVRKYCDRIALADLAPYRAGVRAQAVARDGRLIDDFLFARTANSLHVCNAPSPAATAAIPIAAHVADRLLGDAA